MADPTSWKTVEQGWAVVAADGSSAGRIDEVVGDEEADIFNGLKILTGKLGAPKYVPSEQVGEIVEGTVHLTLTPDEVSELGEYREPPPSEQFLA